MLLNYGILNVQDISEIICDEYNTHQKKFNRNLLVVANYAYPLNFTI